MGTNKNRNAHCHITVFASAAYTDTAWICFFTAFNCQIGVRMNTFELFVEFIVFFISTICRGYFLLVKKLGLDHNSPHSQSQQLWQVIWGWKWHPKLWERKWMLFFFLKFSLNKWEVWQTAQVISERRLILTIICFQLLFQDSTLT